MINNNNIMDIVDNICEHQLVTKDWLYKIVKKSCFCGASISIWGFPLNESGKCVFSGSEQVRIMCLCFLRVRTVYELCQGELILDVANYDYANVFVIHPKRGEKW